MKRVSIDVEPSVGDSRRVLGDLLIIAIVFVTLSAFSSTVLAVQTPRYYVAVFNNYGQWTYRSVRGNQDTLQFSVVQGVGSFVGLVQLNNDYWNVGFVKGSVAKNNTDGSQGSTWLSTPHFYVDRRRAGIYNFRYFTPVSGNHQYWAFLFHSAAGGTDIFYAIIDSTTLQTSESGYYNYPCQASGQTETHSTSDHMNHHFSNMKAGELWLTLSPFQNDVVLVNETYSISPLNPTTEWWATGGL